MHETLNLAGIWKPPFMLVCEDNRYQASQYWPKMRVQREMRAYFEPHGFNCLEVEGNDARAVTTLRCMDAALPPAARRFCSIALLIAWVVTAAIFPRCARRIEQEKTDRLAKEPLARGRDACAVLGLSVQQLDQAVGEERTQIASAWTRAQAQAQASRSQRPHDQHRTRRQHIHGRHCKGAALSLNK